MTPTDLKAAHDAAYSLASNAHMDGCQIPPDAIYKAAFDAVVLSAQLDRATSALAEPLHRAAFAFVGSLSAIRDGFEPLIEEAQKATNGADADSRQLIESIRGVEDAIRSCGLT